MTPPRLLHARIALGLALSFGAFVATAEPDNGLVARLSYLDIESGLSGDLIIAMTQDRKGFVWIGTDRGLDRYDGSRIRPVEILRNRTISSLLSDRDGQLWIGTWGHGLYRYDIATESFEAFRNDPQDSTSLQSDYVDSLTELGDGRIAVGTQAGVDLLDVDSRGIERLQVESEPAMSTDLRVRHLLEDSQGNLWVATRAGLYVKKRGVSRLRMYPSDGGDAVLRENIYALVEDGDGALLLGTSAGVWRLDANGNLGRYVPAGREAGFLNGNRISSLLLTRNGDLFIGTLEHGAFLEQRQRGLTRAFTQQPTAPYGIHDNQIASLLETSDGTLWIGTLTRGISRASPLSLALEHYVAIPGALNALADNRVNAIAPHGDTVFIATEQALTQFEPARRRFTSISESNGWTLPPGFDGIQKISRAASGRFWLMGDKSRNRLYRMDPKTRTVEAVALAAEDDEPVEGYMVNVVEDDEGTVWIAWYESLLGRLAGTSGKLEIFTLTDPADGALLFINGFEYHARHGLVASTDRGPLIVDPAGRHRWLALVDADVTINNAVFDDDGSFWLSTDFGAYRYSADGRLLQHDSQEDGLPGDELTAIAGDAAGRTWFATGRGITVRETDGSFHTLRARDGLQSDYVTSVDFASTGEMLVAGPNGFNIFRYESLADAIRPAAFHATSIELFTAAGATSTLPATETSIALQPEQDHLRLHFSLLDFSDPQRNHYEYRVLGANEQWTSIENTPRIMLQQIDPGSYVLELRATGPNGVAAANGISLAIEALPHWYESVVAKIFYALAAACPFALLAWLGFRYLRTRSTLEAEISRRQLLETIYQLATALADAETETEVARECLEQLQSLMSFRQGALYFRKGEALGLADAIRIDAAEREWLEALPSAKPRLMAKIAFNDAPLAFLASDADPSGSHDGLAPYWLGVAASTRGGKLAVLLLARDFPWERRDSELMSAVFRQIVHGLDASMTRLQRQGVAHVDETSGLLTRDVFLAAATYVLRTSGDGPLSLLAIEVFLPDAGVPAPDAAARMAFARIGQRILAQLHSADVAGHVDEARFAVLLSGMTAGDAHKLAARMRSSVEGVDGVNVSVRVRECSGSESLSTELACAFDAAR